MQETEYKSYRIRYHCVAEWFALIFRLGSNLAMGGANITATVEEGEQVLLSRARARIDQEESPARKA